MTARTPGAAGLANIGVGIAVSSAAGYALLVIAGRALEPAEFALFVAFWGVLFGIGSSLSTIEQDTARVAASTRAEAHGPTDPAAHAVTTAAAFLGSTVAALTVLPPVSARLYGADGAAMGWLVVAAAAGFAMQFAVRGLLIGIGDVRRYSLLVMLEAMLRLALLVPLLLAGRVQLWTAGVAVALGSFAWVAWARRARSVLPGPAVSAAVWLRAVRRAGSLMVAAALSAAVITGYPTVVALLTTSAPSAAGGAVFAALTISRVPLLLVSPVQAMTVPWVVRASAGRGGAGWTVGRAAVVGTVATVLCSLGGAAVAYVAGPSVVRMVYGPDYVVPAGAVAVLVASAFVLAWVLVLCAALLALDGRRDMTIVWAAAFVCTAAMLALSTLGPVETTAAGALVGPLVAAPTALWLLRSRVRRAEALGQPASPEGVR